MRRLRLASSLLGVTLLAACSGLPREEQETSSEAIAVAGRWKLPANVAAAGKDVVLKYDGAPSWSSRACSGRLKTGADRLGDYLDEQFNAITSVGGYACRQNTANRAKMSVHGTGRALDIFIPKMGRNANNGKGDAVANWLVMNADKIGVQLVIWDRTVWQANGRGDKQYTGPHPHDDHLHVELTIPGSEMKTPWFRSLANGDAGAIDLEPEPDTDDTDAGMAPTPPPPDAGTTPPPQPEPDPEPDPDDEPGPDEPGPDEPEPPPDPTPPPGSEPTPPPDTTAPSDPGGSPSTDLPSEGSEEPLHEDEPAEGDSEGPSKKGSKSKRTRSYDDVASSGCSAASGTRGGAFAFPLALVLAGALARRRRRAA